MIRLRFTFLVLLVGACASVFLSGCGRQTPLSDVPGAQSGDSEMALRIRQAMAAPSPSLRIVRLSEVLEDLSVENVPDVLEVYKREFSMVSPGELSILLESWAGFDPEAAYEFTLSLPKSTRREEAMGVVVQAWALNDPEAARDRTVADLKRRKEVYVGPSTFYENLTIGWSHSGQPGLLEHLSQEGDASRVISLRAYVGAQTRRLGTAPFLESMLPFFQTTEEDPETLRFKKMVLIALVAVSAKREPELTSQWLKEFDSERFAGLEAKKRVAWYWLPLDPTGTFAWVNAGFPPEEGEQVMIESFDRWFKQDEEGALAWLETPNGPDLLQDYGHYVNAKRPRVPAELDLVRSTNAIKTESLRRRALVPLLVRWYQREPIYAESWLQSSDLPEAVRESVRNDAISPARPPGESR